MLDFQLTVAKQMGFSPLLPNGTNAHMFSFKMDLKRPTHKFYRKHSMIGFDTTGSILYIGQAINVDVYLAMAPNSFLTRFTPACLPRYSTGLSIISIRHYQQIVMMLAHFLGKIPDQAYYTLNNPNDIDLDATSLTQRQFTNVL